LPLDGPHGEGWHADDASADSMTGWEPIVVKPLIILRQIKTVETVLCSARPRKAPSAWGFLATIKAAMKG
jgi:hypothetical protein